MPESDVAEALYDEAMSWLGAGNSVAVNVAGSWIEIGQMFLDPGDSVVKGYTPENAAVWFALSSLSAVREIIDVGTAKPEPATWIPR